MPLPRRDGQGQERGFRKSALFTIEQCMDKLGQKLTMEGHVLTGEENGWTSADRRRQWVDKCGQKKTMDGQVRAGGNLAPASLSPDGGEGLNIIIIIAIKGGGQVAHRKHKR